MNEERILIDLDHILPYLCPQREEGKERKKIRPTASERSLFSSLYEGELQNDVALAMRLRTEDADVQLHACADSISFSNGIYSVSEEVSCDRQVDFQGSLRDFCLCRSQFLALALCHKKKLQKVGIRLVCFAQGRVEQESFLYTNQDLSDLLSVHIPRIFSLLPLFRKSSASVVFPHKNLREGQKTLIHAAWSAIKTGTKLYACAPTGIGKTSAVLYPALRAVETGKIRRVYYASPKNTIKKQAAETVEAMQEEKGFRTLVLDARAFLCPVKKQECEKALCEYAADFWKKLPDALVYLSSFSLITHRELSFAAETWRICPFDLARKMLPYCQVVIGDYNHLFDPEKTLAKDREDSVLLLDEAHNLPGRCRDNLTETLLREDFDPFFNKNEPVCTMLKPHLAELMSLFTAIDKMRNDTRVYHSAQAPEKVAAAVKVLLPKFAFALQEGFGPLSEEMRAAVRECYRKLKKFLRLFEGFNEDFATLYPPEGGISITLVNPRETIRRAANDWRSVLFFSATLQPQDYFFELLGADEEDSFLDLPSPFPKENLFVGIAPIDVSFSRRFDSAAQICSMIRTATSAKTGNYMVFLPSFEYLRLVSQEYKRRFFDDRILIQEKVMTAKKRAEFLKTFEENRGSVLIGFCVMGSIFSEGIDLKGDSLSGEIIVGTGFPPPSPESEAECEAYYRRDRDGKSFAYTLPGWNRVLQAAGRVIRSETDRGFIILCDARYQGEDMLSLFPESWEGAQRIERDADLKRHLKEFWK